MANRWLRANHQHPFFLFLHTYDVHDRCPFMTSAGAVWPELSVERRQELLDYYGPSDLGHRPARRRLLATRGARGPASTYRRASATARPSEHGARPRLRHENIRGARARALLMRYPPKISPGHTGRDSVSLLARPTFLTCSICARAGRTGHILPGSACPARPRDPPRWAVHCGDALAVARGPFK